MRLTRSLYVNTLAVVFVFFVAGSAASRDEQSQQYPVSPGQKIEFDIESGGSITVEGWDESTARVMYYERYGNLGHFDVKIKKTRNGLLVTAEKDKPINHMSLHFDVRVPRRFDVEVYTMGGSLELTNLEGTFEGKTMGGSLELENIVGEVDLVTMGGNVRVVDSELDGEILTYGGPVLVENVIGDFEATSYGGNVRYKNVRTRDGEMLAPKNLRPDKIFERTVLISTMGGSVDVDEAPEGASIYTGGGEIRVRNAERFVQAQTGGGDIEIHIVSGKVEAWTGAGDVDIIIEKDSGEENGGVTVFTGNGDIYLSLPADFSMMLDLDLAFTRNSSRNYRIISDWDFEEERTSEWSYSNGSPRKHVYGSGSFAGGRYRIKIRTVNGNIRIEKHR